MRVLILLMLVLCSGCACSTLRINFRDKAGDVYGVAVYRNQVEFSINKYSP